MNKVIVFGEPGGGKSTLSRKLSSETGIKLCTLDLIEYKKNGERVSPEEYSKRHVDLIVADKKVTKTNFECQPSR
jgi:adenylate kinase family enzyme